MTASVSALLSMLCAACNDVVFKLYRRKHRPFGGYFAVVGVVWLAVFTIAAAPRTLLDADAVTWRWGLASGCLSLVSNLLLVHAMGPVEVGTCATIFRLNLAPAALLAFPLFGEPVTFGKLAGIGAAVLAVLLMFTPENGDDAVPRHGTRRALLLVVTASLLRAGMGLAYKRGLALGADQQLLLIANAVVWLLGGILFGWAVEQHTGPTPKVGWYGLVSGLLICGIVHFMAAALARGDASSVLPITQLSFAGSALLGVVLLGESLTWRKVAGLAMAVLCVVLLAPAH